MSITRSMTFIVALASLLLSSFASPMDLEAAQHAGHVANSPSALIEAVRRGTEVFRDVRNAAPDYGPILGCVSGPDQGAMGVHFANPALLERAPRVGVAGQLERRICRLEPPCLL